MDRYAVTISTEQRILGAADDEEELESTVIITDRTDGVTLKLPIALIIALGTYLTDTEELEEIAEPEPEPAPQPQPKRLAVKRSVSEET
jgi:hypothetical protein